jgi:hypothetical protein
MRRWNDPAFLASEAISASAVIPRQVIMSGRVCLVALVVMLSACGRRAEELPAKTLPETTGGQAAAGQLVMAGGARQVNLAYALAEQSRTALAKGVQPGVGRRGHRQATHAGPE